MRIGLVGCVKRKRPEAAEAADLYTSPLFQGARQAVERTCDRWFILSAKHGLLAPDAVTEPYDESLNDVSAAQRRRWSEHVLGQLREPEHPSSGDPRRGRSRSSSCRRGSRRSRQVEIPAEGLGLGRKLAFYRNKSAAPPAGRHPDLPGSGAALRPRAGGAEPETGSVSRPPPPQPGSQYRPLYEHLWEARTEGRELTFAEIERVLSVPLPASARRHRPWWGNQTDASTRPQARAWLAAGYEVASVDLIGERVTFRRW